MDINKAELLDAIKQDEELKLEIFQAIIDDEKLKLVLAKEVFNMPIEYLGVNIPGTIGECIKQIIDE